MNNIEHDYLKLLKDILDNGVEKQDRTGTGTHSVFGRQIRHKMSEGFPLLTTKKMPFKTITTELLWFLRGDTNIKYLVDNNCHIWDGDAYKNYAWQTSMDASGQLTKEEFINKIKTDDKFAKKWGELGPIYGKQWRNWTGDVEYWGSIAIVDQIQNLISDLKTNPDSRRLMVSAWNVGELNEMVLPPCHYGFQVYTRELSHKERCDLFGHNDSINRDYSYSKWLDDNGFPTRAISLMWNQRSVDTFLGLPFNIASYGLLLEIIAKEVNMIPDELIGNLGDVHLYSNHIEQAKEQISRKPMELPTVCLDYREGEYDKDLKGFVPDDFVLFNYQSHPTIKAPLSNENYT
jgi:thymidylate synthase